MARHCVHAALARWPERRPLFFAQAEKSQSTNRALACFIPLQLCNFTSSLNEPSTKRKTFNKLRFENCRERERERERERAVVAGTKQSVKKFSKTKENNKNTHKKKDKRIFFPFQGRSFYFINSQFCNWKALVPIKYRNCSFFSVC